MQDKIQMCQHIPAAVTQPCLAAGDFLQRVYQGLSAAGTLQDPLGIVLLKHPRAGQRELLLLRTAPGIEAAPQSGAELV